jgi:hypothetical protein
MYSEFENLDSSAVSKKAGNSKKKAAKSDGSHGIGSAWIHALTLVWIATLFLSVASACASLP